MAIFEGPIRPQTDSFQVVFDLNMVSNTKRVPRSEAIKLYWPIPHVKTYMYLNDKYSSFILLTTLQMLSSHTWLVMATLDSVGTKHFHHCRSFYWTTVF